MYFSTNRIVETDIIQRQQTYWKILNKKLQKKNLSAYANETFHICQVSFYIAGRKFQSRKYID